MLYVVYMESYIIQHTVKTFAFCSNPYNKECDKNGIIFYGFLIILEILQFMKASLKGPRNQDFRSRIENLALKGAWATPLFCSCNGAFLFFEVLSYGMFCSPHICIPCWTLGRERFFRNQRR